MEREALKAHILERYNAESDRPWRSFPGYEVFRHPADRKWFALIADVPKEKLGIGGKERVDVVNLKCGPELAGSFRMEEGILPAYHMNKEGWVSVLLDGTVPEDRIRLMVDISYELTRPKVRAKKQTEA